MASLYLFFSCFKFSTQLSGNLIVSLIYLKLFPVSHTVAYNSLPLSISPVPSHASCAVLEFSFSSSNVMLPPPFRLSHMVFSLTLQLINSHSSFRAQFRCHFLTWGKLSLSPQSRCTPHYSFYSSTSYSFLVYNCKSE